MWGFYFLGLGLTAYALADFWSGLFHWWEDRYAVKEWPIIGKHIAGPNELHHTHPMAFTESSYFSRNFITILLSAVMASITYLCGCHSVIWLSFIFLSQANEVHAWGHLKGKVNWLIALFQETGILQSPTHHAGHHVNPFGVKYCVMTDWCNPFLDIMGFWRTIEWAASKFGAYPKDDFAGLRKHIV